jgi:radical SAM protein with 4Fe4S-binding SPASM domain
LWRGYDPVDQGDSAMLKKIAGRFLRRSTRFPGFRFRTGNRFLTVRMDTTNRCNLRCRMCPMRLSERDPDRLWEDIDPELFHRIEREVFPFARTVGLSCGAEPFCNPRFPEYLKALYRADVPLREVVTNGTLMGHREIASLVEAPPTSLTVSVDGAESGTHAMIRGGSDLDGIMDSVRELVHARNSAGSRLPMVGFSMTLQRSNVFELPDVIELAASVGAVSVGIVPLVPYEGLDMAREVLDMESEEVGDIIARASERACNLGIGFVNAAPDTSEGGCRFVKDWIYIDPQGRVNPCPYWDTSLPLGNLMESSFRDIWEGEGYSSLRDSIRSGNLVGNCRSCPVNSRGTDELRKVQILSQ